jgi:signal transduction histidine kinase
LISGQGTEAVATVGLGEPVDRTRAPYPSNESERLLFRQLYETLVRVDCEGNAAPGLAASWRLDASRSTWIITLRQNARFSDDTPVTAANVAASWMSAGVELRPEVRRLVRSIVAVDDRTLEIALRSQRADASLALAHTDLAIVKPVPGLPWPLGTRSAQIDSSAATPVAAGPPAITLLRRNASPVRFLVSPGRDGRDLLDQGVDLLLTRDPTTLGYAATLPRFATAPLPWLRTHVLLSPGRARPAPSFSEGERKALAQDAVRGEARGAEGPFWWESLSDCEPASSQPSTQAASTTGRIVYDADDGAARDLAERLVGIRTYQRASGLTGEALALALRRGNEAGYVLSLDRRPLDPCREMQVLADNAGWIDPQAIVPLVDTRLQAIVRGGRSGIIAEWDGALLLASSRNEDGRMMLRTRMLVAFGVVVLIPLALLAFGLRHEMTNRLSEEYQVRVDTLVKIFKEDLLRESAGISARLVSLKNALLNDNQFRLAAVAGMESERKYLLDYAGSAMHLTGLSMLQIEDEDGRIVSSGHFRNEHGRVEPGLTAALAAALKGSSSGVALLTTRSPEGEFLSLVRSESLRIGSRTFTLIGGAAVDETFLARLARDPAIVVSLLYSGGGISSAPGQENTADAAVGTLEVPLIRIGSEGPIEATMARLRVTQSQEPLRDLLRSVDSWLLGTAIGAAIAALLLSVWLSSRISRPLAALAAKTAVLDLDRLDVRFDGGTDEVGSLARLLGDLAKRLRTSTARVRDAERRATIGDLARQINHDIKNGLIPLRNVIRHLEQVERDEPAALPSVFAERRPTVDSSIAYLETLATSYQRLSPTPVRRDCDVNALIAEVLRAEQGRDRAEFSMHLTANLPTVSGDPIALRRILENLTVNAVESLESKPGRVSISTEKVDRDGELRVRLTVADTGRGMSKEETSRIFNDFYTTKEGGTGLGLSIVRRLVMDLGGAVAVDSEAGKGTRIIVDIPAGSLERK